MSRLERLVESENTVFDDLKVELRHNIDSSGNQNPETIIRGIGKLCLSMNELIEMEAIVVAGIEKFKGRRRFIGQYNQLCKIHDCIDQKFRMHFIQEGVKATVEHSVSDQEPKLGRRALRKAGLEVKGYEVELPVQNPEAKEAEKKELYELTLPEEEGKMIFGAYDQFVKLKNKAYITKSELMGLASFFSRAAVFLERFGGFTSYEDINKLYNRLDRRARVCGTQVESSKISSDYALFIKVLKSSKEAREKSRVAAYGKMTFKERRKVMMRKIDFKEALEND